MSVPHERPGDPGRRGPIRAPQSLGGGIFLVFLAILALWLNRNLDQGTLNAMGPAMLPDWLAVGVGACGVALLAFAFTKQGDELDHWSLRGPFFVVLGILAFAVTIRPFELGALTIPGLGLVIAGPLAIIIGGFATPEMRLRELIILALCLTPFCMVLFGDLLNLPIPIFPQALRDLFPADWSQKDILRAMAAAMVVGAIVVYALGPKKRTQQVDRVVQPDEGIDG
ncbi:tripartite tricarboxylate transporter TctB family protein [Microvirga roseola]|uniref:tripartite tricarboxylate transporter TctB family protein n=1 Tax=Microvirga roseola TaxID=2883126 RepID=UPI001E500D18|nr:tripartite tricarboxylate transporter TctB family protein [Microvirga roseola]